MAKDKTDIWLPIYVGDYLADTMHLTTEQHGAYLLLIFAYWKNRGKIAEGRVQGIVRMDKDSWTINRGIVEELFDTKSFPGFWYHKRIEKELRNAIIRKQAAENRGKKGMKSRWGNKGDDSSTNRSTNNPTIVEGIVGDNSSPSPSPSPLSSNKSIEKKTLVFEKLKEVLNKFPDQKYQRQIVLFVEANYNKNPDAIIHCLNQFQNTTQKIVNPKAWLEKVLAVENGNFNERESIQKHANHKEEIPVQDIPRLGEVLKIMAGAKNGRSKEAYGIKKTGNVAAIITGAAEANRG
jgi:uncharacterized protein YdaU (DUF1376 family)